MQQLVDEDLGGGLEVKALSGRVVVNSNEFIEASSTDRGKVGFARQGAPHSADGIFDAAFLPGCVRITKEGLEGQAMKLPMAGELGAIVEGDGLPQGFWEQSKDVGERSSDEAGSLVGWALGEDEPGGSLMHGQDGLAVFGEHHEIGFPMAGIVAIAGNLRALGNGYAAFDEVRWASTPFTVVSHGVV